MSLQLALAYRSGWSMIVEGVVRPHSLRRGMYVSVSIMASMSIGGDEREVWPLAHAQAEDNVT